MLGRFIEADATSELVANGNFICLNLYAYCGNNPIHRDDQNGKFWNIVIGAVVGAIVNTAITVADSIINNKPIDIGDVAISAVSGAVSGAIAATGLGPLGQAIGTAITSSATTLISDSYHAYKEGGGAAVIKNLPTAIIKSAGSGAIGFTCSLAGSYAGKALFSGIENKGKTLQEIGKIGYKIGKRARQKLIEKGVALVNTARGLTSVIGTIGTAPMAALQNELFN